MLGSLSLGAAALDAVEFRPYLETAVAPTVVCNSLSIGMGGFSFPFKETDAVGMLSVTAGTQIGALNSQVDFFAECEVDFFNHFSTTVNLPLGESLIKEGMIMAKNEILPVFFNLGLQANKNSDFHPYIYGGIGVSHIKNSAWRSAQGAKETGFSHSSNKFAWQLGAGVDYRIADHLFVDAGYTFAFLGKNKATYDQVVISVKNYAHEFRLGLNYEF